MNLRRVLSLTIVAVTVLVGRPAAAHTDLDLVAVPAGSTAQVTLKPTHGCGDSPTIKVSARVPVSGATGGTVPPWTATATPDDEGRTVIEWSGGSLPADEVGTFPVTFTVPDRVGELLVFPFVQECANGDEWSWINGDPESDNPAPRVLVLPPGSAAAETIDDVPADAPGRDQLSQVVDVDNPVLAQTTTPAPAEGSSTTSTTSESDGEDEDGISWLPIALGAAVVIGLAGVGMARLRR
jgi:periplasmic copper chaperone A